VEIGLGIEFDREDEELEVDEKDCGKVDANDKDDGETDDIAKKDCDDDSDDDTDDEGVCDVEGEDTDS
jgi:hypothetical protein